MMQIYLMRHADAVSQADWPKADVTRPLSARGRSLLEKALPKIAAANFGVKKIFASPFTRAQETAELMARIFPGVTPQTQPKMAAGASIRLYREILSVEKEGPLLVIGHMPEISHVASHLSGEPSLIESGLRPADIILIETGPLDQPWGSGKIAWQRRLEDW